MGEADTLYQELITFLSAPRADLRKAAAEATLTALTPSSNDNSNSSNNEAAQRLASLDAITPLCKIASVASQNEVGSIDALAALSILCSHDLVGNQCMLDFVEGSKGVGRMLEIALSSPPTPPSTAASIAALSSAQNSNDNNENIDHDGKNSNNKLAKEWNEWRRQVNYACALLANATRTEKGAVEFIGLSFPEEAVPSLSMAKDGIEEKSGGGIRDTTKPTATLLLSRFLNPAFVDATSPAYKEAMEAWNAPNHQSSDRKSSSSSMFEEEEEYDPDIDDIDEDELENDETPLSKEPQTAEELVKDGEYYDPYQHVAAVMMNITQLNTGRDFLMRLIHSGSSKKKSDNTNHKTSLDSIQENGEHAKGTTTESTTTTHLQSLLPQLESPNLHRRRGIAGTLKNCCFAKDNQWWLLHVVHLDKSLLLPLAGPEELTIDEKVGLDPDYWLMGPSKVREPDARVRTYLVEALLLLLASGRRARETLRERRMYVIVKLADMVEENEEASERLLECVQYLRRDEDGEAEGSSDRRAYESYARGMVEEDGVKNNERRALMPSQEEGSGGDAVERRGAEDAAEDYDNID